jgi:transcriptional regulator with XRE-family HTH domain
MGRSHRRKPKHLARKLFAIRNKLELSQTEMAKALNMKTAYTAVSAYELGVREPDLIVLLRYARLAKVSVESLIDDKLDLPL